MADYAKEVLVETQWVEEHLDDDSIRIVEVDENPALYAEAHIPGAIGFDWKTDLQDQVKRDFLGADDFGELIAMAGYEQEGAQRAGHIPGAASVPWAQAVNEDGTFKSADELRELYKEKGVLNGNDVIAYCRIGERSAHTWFVLTRLLGYPDVRNYDGSWTEWGSLVRAPIEKNV